MSLESALAALGGNPPAADAAATPSPETKAPGPAGGTPVPESAALTDTVGVTPPGKQESASQAFKLIAQEKRRILEQKQQAQTRDKELSEREARIREQEGRTAKRPQTPLEALQAAGFTYKDATDFLMNNEQLTPEQQIRSVKDEIASFKKEQEDAKAQAAADEKSRAEASHAEAVEGFKTRVMDHVSSQPEKYELSALEDPDDIKNLGYQLADLHFNQHKKVLSVEEVSDLVESYLEERAAKYAASKKIQAKFKPADAIAGAQEGGARAALTTQAQAQPTPPKTLAAAITSAPAPVYNPARSEAERIKRAMEALERMGK